MHARLLIHAPVAGQAGAAVDEVSAPRLADLVGSERHAQRAPFRNLFGEERATSIGSSPSPLRNAPASLSLTPSFSDHSPRSAACKEKPSCCSACAICSTEAPGRSDACDLGARSRSQSPTHALVAAQDGVDGRRGSVTSRAAGSRSPGVQGAVGQCPSHGGGDLLEVGGRSWRRYGSASQWSRRTSRASRSPSSPAAVAASSTATTNCLPSSSSSHTACPDRSASPRLPLAILYSRPPRSGNGRTLSAHALSIR